MFGYSDDLKSARSLGVMIAGLVGGVLLLAQAHGSVDNDDEQLRFFEKLPPGVAAKFAPEGWTEADYKASDSQLEQRRERPAPQYLYADITGATLDGSPVIEFEVTDEFGLGIAGLDGGAFSFTVNKLVPGAGGKTENWSTYILVDRAPDGEPLAAPSTYSGGSLEDLGGGNYRFTFDQALEDIAGVAFEPTLTHRVGMEIRGAVVSGQSVPNANTFDTAFDIQPSSGQTEGIAQRKITTQEDCAACHGTEEFAFHGGPRKDVDQCVSCHQPGLESVTGDSIDMTVMIHKIHAGENLSQPYELCGFPCRNLGAPPTSFNNVKYPQSEKNCVTCHDPHNVETPQAEFVDNRATAEVCASCHDNLAFDETGLTNANRNHIGLAQPDETCVACHSDSGLLQGNLAYHAIDSQEAAKRFQYNILDISYTAEGDSPVVTFSITDPTNDDEPYDLLTHPAFTGSATSINMIFAWPNTDFTNVANPEGTEITGRPVGQPRSITIVDSSDSLPEGVFDNGDGTYSLDTFALPSPVVIPATSPSLGSGTVAIDGRPAGDFNFDGNYSDRVPATNASMAFAITDPEPHPRRQVVDLAKCQDCHSENDGLSFHGNNRTDDLVTCSTCHNPNSTDLFRRPADPDGVVNTENTAAADFLEDRTVDFAYMIHAIHAPDKREDPYVAYGFGTTPHDFSQVTYPRSSRECLACHVEGSYNLPLEETVLGKTLSSNATRTETGFAPSAAAASDPTIDNKASPEAAVCAACHDSEVAINHMAVRSDSPISFGNAFLMNPDPVNDPDTQAVIDAAPRENCAFCHGADGFVPVADAHGFGN